MICKLTNNIKNYRCGYHLPDIKEIYLLNYSDLVSYTVDDCEYCLEWTDKFYRIDVDNVTFADTLTIGNSGNKYRNVKMTFSIPNHADACEEEAYNNIVLGKYVLVFKTDGIFYVCGLLDGMSVNESESNNETHTITLEENTILTTQIMNAECAQDVVDDANGETPEPPTPTENYLVDLAFSDGQIDRHVHYQMPCDGTTTEIPYTVVRDGMEEIGGMVMLVLTGLKVGTCALSIAEKAFYNQTDMTTALFGNGLEEIGANAFEGCSSLTSFELPDTITTIGDEAFKNCTNLTAFTVNATVPPRLGADVFLKEGGGLIPPLAHIYVPLESVLDYRQAEGWSVYASIISAQQHGG